MIQFDIFISSGDLSRTQNAAAFFVRSGGCGPECLEVLGNGSYLILPIQVPEQREGTNPIKIPEQREGIAPIQISERSEEITPIKVPEQREGTTPIQVSEHSDETTPTPHSLPSILKIPPFTYPPFHSSRQIHP